MYKLINATLVMRVSDNAYIPFDPDNYDYQEYLAWVAAGNVPEQPPAPDAATLKANQLSKINAAAQADVEPYTQGYPSFEQKTWDRQAAEAAAYAADSSAPTPWCDIAAASRGIDRVEFIGKVAAKTAAFMPLSAKVSGYRQKLEDQLDAIDLTAADAADKIAAVVYVSPLEQAP